MPGSLDEPVPGGAHFAYVFGSALLFLMVFQIVTGLCLALYYVPSPLSAHVTLAYSIKNVAGGAFLRSLHSYGSNAMIVVLVLHFLQTFLYGSYKGRRELLWISECVLSLLVLGMTFTGYLLRWDLKAYFAGSVGTSLAGDVPLIGGWLLRLLRGGEVMGALTLSRFYVLHVFLLPATIFLFIAIHIFMFRKAGAAGPIAEDPIHPHLAAENFYPKQVIMDMLFVLVVMGVLGMLAHCVPAEIGPAADSSNSNYLPRPEWYYLPFFEWLKFWEGAKTVIGVIVIHKPACGGDERFGGVPPKSRCVRYGAGCHKTCFACRVSRECPGNCFEPGYPSRATAHAESTRVQGENDLRSTRLRRLSWGGWRGRHSRCSCTCQYRQKLPTGAANHNAAAFDRSHANRWNAPRVPERQRTEGIGGICKFHICVEEQPPITRDLYLAVKYAERMEWHRSIQRATAVLYD